MVILAFAHIGLETFFAFREMVRCLSFKRRLKAWQFFGSFTFSLARSALPVLSRHYHPRNHPICNAEQNEIAIAWRRYFSEGNDVRALTDQDMNLLLRT